MTKKYMQLLRYSLVGMLALGLLLPACTGKKKYGTGEPDPATVKPSGPLPVWPDTNALKGLTRVKIETTLGSMVVALYNQTPKHRDNFIKLAKSNFYNDLLFHRVISGFMIQGGDPDSRNAAPDKSLGQGGPKDAKGAFIRVPAEIVDTLYHLRGALAAARQGDEVNPDKLSSGSQFYIVSGRPIDRPQLEEFRRNISTTRFLNDSANDSYQVRFQMYKQSGDQAAFSRMMAEIEPQVRKYRQERKLDYPEWVQRLYEQQGGAPMLDGDYTVFGQLVEGFETLDRISAVEKGKNDRPATDVKIIRCTVLP